MLLMHWCCWCADAADALILLMLLMRWCTDAPNALMLLMHWCCWCADAADALMRWCCWCADALMHWSCWCCWCCCCCWCTDAADAADALMHWCCWSNDAAVVDKMQIGVRAHLKGTAWSSEFRTVVQCLVFSCSFFPTIVWMDNYLSEYRFWTIWCDILATMSSYSQPQVTLDNVLFLFLGFCNFSKLSMYACGKKEKY